MKQVSGQSKQGKHHDYISKNFCPTVCRCRLVGGMHIPVHRNSKGHNNLLGHSNPHYCHNGYPSLFYYCVEWGRTMNEYKTTITFKSEKPRLVLSTIIDGLYADENLLDYKWDNYKGDSKHKLKITIQSNHGSPSQWIESFAFHETDKIIEIKE